MAAIGPVTAATFMAVIDDATRFGSAKQLRCYLGLVPREYSSAESQLGGHITKAGNRRLRSLLVECAWGISRRAYPETDALRDWALRIAQHRGKRVAAVALARKLAGILFAMTRDNTTFAGNHNQQAKAVAAGACLENLAKKNPKITRLHTRYGKRREAEHGILAGRS